MEPNGDYPYIRRIESTTNLSRRERQALIELPIQRVSIREGQDITREGDAPSRSALLLDGIACTYITTKQGRRQISAFHLQGDMPDLQSLHLHVLDASVFACTNCRVGFVPHEVLNAICSKHPGIAHALWRVTLIDAAVHRQWVANVGRRDAFTRMAHLLCEFATRLAAIGFVTNGSFDLPLTQIQIGDAVGLSTVHVNRTLQALKAAALIRMRERKVEILDWDGLIAAGDFDPAYLHVKNGRSYHNSVPEEAGPYGTVAT